MNSFVKTAIGKLVEFQRGYDLPKSDFVEGPYPVRSSNGVLGYHNKYKCQGSGITIGRSGTVGLPHYIEDDFFPHNTTLFIKDFKGNHPRYIYYLIENLKLNDWKSGSGVPTLNRNHLHPLEIKAHIDLKEQKQIAKVLSDLDAKIEVNNKINAALEALAKTIYDYWFVQFDFPDTNGKPYKSSGGKMVYNDELKRNIPEGWKKGVLDDIAKIVRGVSYSKHDIKTLNDENVTPVLRATNITGNVIDLENMVYVPDEFVSEKQLMNKNDVLITMSSGSKNHIGKNGMFYFDKKVAFGAFCAKLEAKESFQFFLKSYMQSEFISETIKKECLGTSINNLNGSLVKGFRLVKPSDDVLDSFNKKMKPIHNKIGNNQKENQKLAALRDWLLPMLMNGQVTVSQHDEVKGQEEKSLNQEGKNLNQVQDNKLGRVAEGEEKYKVNK